MSAGYASSGELISGCYPCPVLSFQNVMASVFRYAISGPSFRLSLSVPLSAGIEPVSLNRVAPVHAPESRVSRAGLSGRHFRPLSSWLAWAAAGRGRITHHV